MRRCDAAARSHFPRAPKAATESIGIASHGPIVRAASRRVFCIATSKRVTPSLARTSVSVKNNTECHLRHFCLLLVNSAVTIASLAQQRVPGDRHVPGRVCATNQLSAQRGSSHMFQAKPITRALAFAFGGLACAGFTSSALAQAAAPQTLERVEITGSAIKRIEGESALPVTVITKQEIDQMGVVNAAATRRQAGREQWRGLSALRTRWATRHGRASPAPRCAAWAPTAR